MPRSPDTTPDAEATSDRSANFEFFSASSDREHELGVEPSVGVLRVGSIAVGVAGVAALLIARGPASSSSRPGGGQCDGFDFPVGPPDGTGYYDAQPFGENLHLGNDWNGNSGGDSDLGDPVHAVAVGVVLEAADHGGGWGNVVRIEHYTCGDRVESLYAHLDQIAVRPGQQVARGQRVGTIGTAHGHYRAHLHFELRDRQLPLGNGYGDDARGYLDATAYIHSHRPR